MDKDVLDLEKIDESKRTGFPLVETRYSYIQAFMNGILDPNLLNEFMKAYELTRKNEDQSMGTSILRLKQTYKAPSPLKGDIKQKKNLLLKRA